MYYVPPAGGLWPNATGTCCGISRALRAMGMRGGLRNSQQHVGLAASRVPGVPGAELSDARVPK